MNIQKSILFSTMFCGLMAGFFASGKSAFAVVDTSSSELSIAADLIAPSGDSFPTLEGYSSFSLQSKMAVANGLLIKYKAMLLADPWFDSELPEVQLLIYSYSSQDAATTAFNQIADLDDFSNGKKTILSSDDHTIFYQTKDNDAYADVFSTVRAEYLSYHIVERNGNLIFQSSLYRTDGEFNTVNLQTYADDTASSGKVKPIIEDVINHTKIALSVLFPPTEADYDLKNESSSVNLSDVYNIPIYGSVGVNVYISSLTGATGTILDSSGISAAEEGDLYLYVNGNGQVLAGIYAPNFDADCDLDGGWYRLTDPDPLFVYEWNAILLHYGVGGFSLSVNGEVVDSCNVSQPRSANNLYLGDFPSDAMSESMIGYADNFLTELSLTYTGEAWDTVLAEQLFLDLPNTDPDLAIFQYLKEKGIFLGSDGMLYADKILNRAEMVKIILKSFNRNPDAGNMVPFWDVPIDAWYRKYIAKAYDIEMVKGNDDGSFAPAAEINRAEFFTMLYRLRGSSRMEYKGGFTDVTEDDWYALGAEFALENGVATGTEFFPSQTITRREAAKVLYTLLKSV